MPAPPPSAIAHSSTVERFDFASGGMPGESLHALLAELRAEGPVVPVRFTGGPAWMITRYRALAAAFRDNERFPPGPAYARTTEPAVGRSFISMDGDEHRVYRTLATPAFRPRAVAAYDDGAMAALAHELVDGFANETEVDLVPRFAQRFPLLLICRLLGIPRDAEQRFQDWALGLLSFPYDPERARRASVEFTAYLRPILSERRRAPQADVISELLAAEVEGRRLDDEEVLSHVRLLFPTGAETTASGLGSLFYALLAEPRSWERVRTRPEERAWAVEELLRWENPVVSVPRVSASVPIEFEGARIAPDTPVLFCIAAAHRDPEVFRDPARYDLDRRPTELLAFGPGPRQCPGMHLARKEMRIALGVLCERLPRARLLDPEGSRPAGTVLRTPPSLRVALR
jgi:cytochrome P450